MMVKMMRNKTYSKKELEKIFGRKLFNYQVACINYIILNPVPSIQIRKVKYKPKANNINKTQKKFVIDEIHTYKDIKMEEAIKRWTR